MTGTSGGIGDLVHQALTLIGVTTDKVEQWLGKPCNCEKRQQKLNALGWWAQRVIVGKTTKAVDYLMELIDA